MCFVADRQQLSLQECNNKSFVSGSAPFDLILALHKFEDCVKEYELGYELETNQSYPSLRAILLGRDRTKQQEALSSISFALMHETVIQELLMGVMRGGDFASHYLDILIISLQCANQNQRCDQIIAKCSLFDQMMAGAADIHVGTMLILLDDFTVPMVKLVVQDSSFFNRFHISTTFKRELFVNISVLLFAKGGDQHTTVRKLIDAGLLDLILKDGRIFDDYCWVTIHCKLLILDLLFTNSIPSSQRGEYLTDQEAKKILVFGILDEISMNSHMTSLASMVLRQSYPELVRETGILKRLGLKIN